MEKFLLINGAKEFGHSGGKLNDTLHKSAKETLKELGKSVKETVIDKGYDVKKEIKKISNADVIIWQLPAWWMGEPWIVKRYIDEVFTAGKGVLFKDDGRSSKSPTKGYGTGGLLQGKRYLLSVTWNAPVEAFLEKDQFFEGAGVNMVYFHFHKLNQFLGLAPFDTFVCNDVMKNPNVEMFVKNYKEYLQKLFATK